VAKLERPPQLWVQSPHIHSGKTSSPVYFRSRITIACGNVDNDLLSDVAGQNSKPTTTRQHFMATVFAEVRLARAVSRAWTESQWRGPDTQSVPDRSNFRGLLSGDVFLPPLRPECRGHRAHPCYRGTMIGASGEIYRGITDLQRGLGGTPRSLEFVLVPGFGPSHVRRVLTIFCHVKKCLCLLQVRPNSKGSPLPDFQNNGSPETTTNQDWLLGTIGRNITTFMLNSSAISLPRSRVHYEFTH
jgi:hypothetical protein